MNNLGYHYTSVDVFLKMLDGIKDDSLTFHASSVFALNDPSEFLYGYEKVWEILPQIEDELGIKERLYQLSKMADKDETMTRHRLKKELLAHIMRSAQFPFVVSYSKKGDYLPQWTLYGDEGKGVALGVDIQKYLPIITPTVRLSFINLEGYNALPITYGDISENSGLRTAIKNLYKDYYVEVQKKHDKDVGEFQFNWISDLLLFASALIKHEAYEYEHESRLLMYMDKTDYLCFRTSKEGRIVPYVEMKIPLSYLKGVIVGPRCNDEHSIRMKLLKCGLSSVEVSKSLIPYRG